MSNEKLPHRFRQAAFKRYELVIEQVLRDFPMPIVFKPARDYGLSPVTFSNRLRDAITSQRNNQWPSILDMAKFIQCCDEIIVSELPDGSVVVANEETLREFKRTYTSLPRSEWRKESWTTFNINIAGEDVLKAVCLLLHNRLLPNCRFVVDHIPTELIEQLQQKYDVSIAVDQVGEEKQYTIL